jgi:hypothetical protein
MQPRFFLAYEAALRQLAFRQFEHRAQARRGAQLDRAAHLPGQPLQVDLAHEAVLHQAGPVRPGPYPSLPK